MATGHTSKPDVVYKESARASHVPDVQYTGRLRGSGPTRRNKWLAAIQRLGADESMAQDGTYKLTMFYHNTHNEY
jgi:hypothetical protein